MNKQKVILLFSDLEGTILKEEFGTYRDEDMYHFLEKINELQTITGASVRMHLVSPVYVQKMQKIMELIDKNIDSYNRINRGYKQLLNLEGAAAFEDADKQYDKYDDRILIMKKPVNKTKLDIDRYGKANYVKNWCEIYSESETKELIMSIYCGNGKNDLDAIDYINSQKNGFSVCPKNSKTLAKEKVFFVSEKEDLEGITEGIDSINKEIKKRINRQEKEECIKEEKELEEK